MMILLPDWGRDDMLGLEPKHRDTTHSEQPAKSTADWSVLWPTIDRERNARSLRFILLLLVSDRTNISCCNDIP